MKKILTIGMLLVAACFAFTACNKGGDDGNNKYTLKVFSNNNDWGSVFGGGVYAEGSDVEIYGTPAMGYKFAQWNDGVTDNPRMVHLTSDTMFMAQFADLNSGTGTDPGINPGQGDSIVADSNTRLIVTFGDTTWYGTILVRQSISDLYQLTALSDNDGTGISVSFYFDGQTGTHSYSRNDGKWGCYYLENSNDYVTIDGQQYPHWLCTTTCTTTYTEYDADQKKVTGTVRGRLLNMAKEAAGETPEYREIYIEFERFIITEYGK